MKQHSSSYLFLFLATALLYLSLAGCSVNNGDGGGVAPPSPIYPQPYAQPSVSPDGSKMLFVRNKVTRINKGGGFSIDSDSSGIWVADTDGRNMKLLIQSQNLGSPSFSPDLQWMLFEGGGQIYKVPFAGDSVDMDRLVQLTTEGRNFFPTWSPNRHWIAYDNTVCGSFNESPPPNSCGILKMEADGAQKKLVAVGRMPNWSSDSKRLLYVGLKSEIFSITLEDSTVSMLTSFNQDDENSIDNRYPKYSPNGAKITFHSDLQVWIMQADGSNPKQIHKKGTQPAWDESGKVVFVDFDPHRFSKDNGTIWIMNADGSNKTQLTFNHGLELEQ